MQCALFLAGGGHSEILLVQRVPWITLACLACDLKSQRLSKLHQLFVSVTGGKPLCDSIWTYAQTQMWVILYSKNNIAFPGEQDKQGV